MSGVGGKSIVWNLERMLHHYAHHADVIAVHNYSYLLF